MLALTTVAASILLNLSHCQPRSFLQAPAPKPAPFNSSQTCQQCISSGFVYCIPGAEGSDPSTWGKKQPVCCQDMSTCAQAKTYTCSNSYSDPTMAYAICPYYPTSCGQFQAFNFTVVGQQQNQTLTLKQGDTCTFYIESECGLPAFSFDSAMDSSAFSIDVVDYDIDDIKPYQSLQNSLFIA